MGARVGDAGGSGVRDDCNARAGFQFGGKLFGTASFVEEVITDGGGVQIEVVQQLLGLARVLTCDLVGLAQDTQGAQGNVLQIADGSGYEIEAGG